MSDPNETAPDTTSTPSDTSAAAPEPAPAAPAEPEPAEEPEPASEPEAKPSEPVMAAPAPDVPTLQDIFDGIKLGDAPPARKGPRLVVIESPYAGNYKGDQPMVEHHLRYLRACMRDCFARGEAPYASHGLYTQPGVLDDNDPAERQHGIEAGFAWCDCAEATVVYVDIGRTKGMEFGIADAQAKGRPIEFRTIGESWYNPTAQTTARWGA